MFCRKCGKEIDGSSRFCEFCGQKVLAENNIPDRNTPEVTIVQNSKKNSNDGNTMLRVVEIILWLGVGIILLNIFGDVIDLWGILVAEVFILSGLGYIKNWHRNFEIPLVLMIIGVLINISVFSWADIIIYVIGIYGLILKKKSID